MGWWPFRRSGAEPDVSAISDLASSEPIARAPRRDWQRLPPPTTSLGRRIGTVQRSPEAWLSSYRDPSSLRPLVHGVDRSAPGGVIRVEAVPSSPSGSSHLQREPVETEPRSWQPVRRVQLGDTGPGPASAPDVAGPSVTAPVRPVPTVAPDPPPATTSSSTAPRSTPPPRPVPAIAAVQRTAAPDPGAPDAGSPPAGGDVPTLGVDPTGESAPHAATTEAAAEDAAEPTPMVSRRVGDDIVVTADYDIDDFVPPSPPSPPSAPTGPVGLGPPITDTPTPSAPSAPSTSALPMRPVRRQIRTTDPIEPATSTSPGAPTAPTPTTRPAASVEPVVDRTASLIQPALRTDTPSGTVPVQRSAPRAEPGSPTSAPRIETGDPPLTPSGPDVPAGDRGADASEAGSTDTGIGVTRPLLGSIAESPAPPIPGPEGVRTPVQRETTSSPAPTVPTTPDGEFGPTSRRDDPGPSSGYPTAPPAARPLVGEHEPVPSTPSPPVAPVPTSASPATPAVAVQRRLAEPVPGTAAHVPIGADRGSSTIGLQRSPGRPVPLSAPIAPGRPASPLDATPTLVAVDRGATTPAFGGADRPLVSADDVRSSSAGALAVPALQRATAPTTGPLTGLDPSTSDVVPHRPGPLPTMPGPAPLQRAIRPGPPAVPTTAPPRRTPIGVPAFEAPTPVPSEIPPSEVAAVQREHEVASTGTIAPVVALAPQPTIQRLEEPRSAPVESSSSAGGDASDQQPGPEEDEALVDRIYERLRWRLRGELLVERERYGQLIDREW